MQRYFEWSIEHERVRIPDVDMKGFPKKIAREIQEKISIFWFWWINFEFENEISLFFSFQKCLPHKHDRQLLGNHLRDLRPFFTGFIRKTFSLVFGEIKEIRCHVHSLGQSRKTLWEKMVKTTTKKNKAAINHQTFRKKVDTPFQRKAPNILKTLFYVRLERENSERNHRCFQWIS